MHEIHKSEFLYIKYSFSQILTNWNTFMDIKTYANPYLQKTKEMYFIFKNYHKKITKEKIELDILEDKHFPSND
jgi:hypothetical protein